MKEMKFLLMMAGVFLFVACDSANRYDPCGDNDDMCKTEGIMRCSSDDTAVQTCEKNKEGCFVWTETDNCAEKGWTCSEAGDEPKCAGECLDLCNAQDDTRCKGTIIQKCQRASNGCLDWADDQDCAQNSQYCDDTGSTVVCSSDCPDPCDATGMSRCDGDVIETCTLLDEDCSSWVFEQDCSLTGGSCQEEMGAAWCRMACAENTDCDETDYCKKDSCDVATGICELMPSGCPENYSPVCGCDEKTYGNDCEAAAAGISVDHKGECGTTQCFGNDMCPPEQYCLLPGCGANSGSCADRPLDCPDVWDPVCGCDGQTYSSECDAGAAGMTIMHAGECEQKYCWSNDMCDEGQYCLFDGCDAESGTCAERPVDCPDVWDPVCGCDRQTYGNRCEAEQAGISIDHAGECGEFVCRTNSDCGQVSLYCVKLACDDEFGGCTPRPSPSDCPNTWDPVCACNGQTYPNSCAAAANGQNIDHKGECGPPQSCFGNNDCPNNRFCHFDSCAAETGTCRPIPVSCPEMWDPVCACDGQTYDNACYAAYNSQSVDYRGECVQIACSGNSDCADELLYCKKEYCDDVQGVCETKPLLSDCAYSWEPVCGCDNTTYANRCMAEAYGQNVDFEGECSQQLSCSPSESCPDGSFCYYVSCDDNTGSCHEIPLDCPEVWSPVCGCDGVTYANVCVAAQQMASIAYFGECN